MCQAPFYTLRPALDPEQFGEFCVDLCPARWAEGPEREHRRCAEAVIKFSKFSDHQVFQAWGFRVRGSEGPARGWVNSNPRRRVFASVLRTPVLLLHLSALQSFLSLLNACKEIPLGGR